MVCICFPGSTTVITKKGVKRMDELTPSDKVLTYSKGQGVKKWTPFYTWGHFEPKRVAEFMVLKVSDGRELQISSEHLLFVVGEKGKRVTKRAKEVCEGDKLCCFGQNEGLESETVVDIQNQSLAGVFAPFTISGDFVANGFLVSCYAEIDHQVAHAALAPLRAWYGFGYRLRRNQKKAGHPGKEGIHVYARSLMKFREHLIAARVTMI